jgi:putative transposase
MAWRGAPNPDCGSIFKAKRAMVIYAALGIHKEQIQRRQPYIETTFNVQRRMADYYFERTLTWEALFRRHQGHPLDSLGGFCFTG